MCVWLISSVAAPLSLVGTGILLSSHFAYALGGPSAAIFIKSLALPMWTGRSVSVLPGRLQLQATGLAAAIAAGSIIAWCCVAYSTACAKPRKEWSLQQRGMSLIWSKASDGNSTESNNNDSNDLISAPSTLTRASHPPLAPGQPCSPPNAPP